MKKIAWIIPSPIMGSGGHRTIFQNANYLASTNYNVDVYVQKPKDMPEISDEEMKDLLTEYFGEMLVTVYSGIELRGMYDLIFATAWFTAKYVRDIKQLAKKAYFIQDYEALFNPMGDNYLSALNSYTYGLLPVTIGKWLSNKMINEFGSPSNYFDFCADLKVYRKINSIKKEKAICFIFQPEKPRRCSRLGIEALRIVKQARPDITIYLYGSNSKKNIDFEHTNLELISITECNELYNKCMLGLCISSSNPSRIPFEMMAAGLPVVDIFMENNLYDMPEEGVTLASTSPESIAKAILDLLANESKLNQMSVFGESFMKSKDLSVGFKQFGDAVDMMLENDDYSSIVEISKLYQKDPVR